MRRNLIPPPVWALIAGSAMWCLHHWLPLGRLLVHPWNQLGWFIGAVGVAIIIASMLAFRRAETTVNPLEPTKATKLVMTGTFGFSRNPMYLGLLLVLTGWAVGLGSISPFIVLPVFVVLITVLQIIPEERALAGLFGREYEEYMRAVPRWFGLRGRRAP
jgi:protein-S-isoprenylcysteine O-methyltransferase Ste14